MMYSLPLAITGVDCPGKSATQSASLTVNLSGRFFSSEAPFCWGPRQLSQPRTGAATPKFQIPKFREIPRNKLQRAQERRGAQTPAKGEVANERRGDPRSISVFMASLFVSEAKQASPCQVPRNAQ